MSDQRPLVSVYIPTKNRVDLLKRAVNSVLSQDYENIEVVIVDDGSDDLTNVYGIELKAKDSRVLYIRNERSQGACFSRNRAIKSANGYYVTGLDDDDYFEPSRISDFISAAEEAKSELVMFYTDNKIINHDGTVKVIVRPSMCDFKDILIKNYVGNQVFGVRRFFLDSDGFDENLPAWQDVEYWYRMSRCFGIQFRKVKGASYVVDQCHDHERISGNSVRRIQSAADYFSRKYELNTSDHAKLMVNVLGYQNKNPGLSAVFKLGVEVKSIRSIRNLVKLSLVNLLGRRR